MQNRKSAKLLAGIFLAAASVASSVNAEADVGSSATNYITNGTFSDHSEFQQTGWDVSSNGYRFKHHSYQEGNIGSAPLGSLSQNVSDTTGSYILSFDLSAHHGGTESVQWDNTVLANFSSPVKKARFSYDVAATGNDTLTFLGENDASFNKISDVTLVAAVPEPESATMFLIGLGLIGWIARRKAASNA